MDRAPHDSGLNVHVAVRFRPSTDSRKRATPLVLPLHQRVKLLTPGEVLGTPEPEEFLDPLTNRIMRDPVLLPCGRAIERSIALSHIDTVPGVGARRP